MKLELYKLLNNQYSKDCSFSCHKNILFLANYLAKNNNKTQQDPPQ